MYPLPADTTSASVATGLSDGSSDWVTGVLLLGIQVDAHVVIDFAEHRRRETVGVTAVTDPVLLDRLLNLPADIPIADPALWAQMAGQHQGTVEQNKSTTTVTRVLRSPLTITDVVVRSKPGRELKAVQKASWFGGFTRRWAAIADDSLPDTVQLEAKLCGVGLLCARQRALMPSGPPVSSAIDKWSWLLEEQAYQRWLSQRPSEREAASRCPATGEASLTRKS